MPEEYPASMFLNLHRAWREGFIVCECFGTTVGFLVGSMSGPKKARILIIAVLEPYRCKGIGTALMEAFTNACGMRGIRSIELEVRVSNRNAIRFYQKHGYRIIDIIPRFYRDGEDGYKMWRAL